MKTDAIAFGVSGMLFGLIAGWIIGTHQVPTPVQAPAAPAQTQAPQGSSSPPAVVNQDQVNAFKAIADREPSNAKARLELGNLYFEAERFEDALPWFVQALKIAPNDVEASTKLGIVYYSTNQPDKALDQFAQSLKLNPKHVQTLLYDGYVRAFGKQDLAGAQRDWQSLLEIAPNSPEAQKAKELLDGLRAHPGGVPNSTLSAPPSGL
jgi:tetratricopeptide (TPR) repeat protein